jgi:hypothetical protein
MAAPPTTLEELANWAVDRATSLPEVWALVAEHSDVLVDAWRLMRVCRAARAGAKEFLSTLPGLVVCGGRTTYAAPPVRDVWRLDHPGFFISDTEEEDQGMAKNRRACSNCGCTVHSTSITRRGPNGIRSLCNACGLRYSRHGTARPVVPHALAPAASKGVVSEIEATSVVQAIAATCSLVKKSRPSRLRVVVRPRPRSQRNQVVTDGLPRRRRGHCLSYHLRHSHHSEHVIC